MFYYHEMNPVLPIYKHLCIYMFNGEVKAAGNV